LDCRGHSLGHSQGISSLFCGNSTSRALYVQVGEVSGSGPTTFDFKQTCNPAVHRIRLVSLRFGVDPFHRWLNAYLLWSPGPIRAFDGKLVSRTLRALSIPATGSVPASINPI